MKPAIERSGRPVLTVQETQRFQKARQREREREGRRETSAFTTRGLESEAT